MLTYKTGTTDKHAVTGHRVPPFSPHTVVHLTYYIERLNENLAQPIDVVTQRVVIGGLQMRNMCV